MTLLYQFYHCDVCDGLKGDAHPTHMWCIVRKSSLMSLQDGTLDMIKSYQVCVSEHDAKLVDDFMKLISTGEETKILRVRRQYPGIPLDEKLKGYALNVGYYDYGFYVRRRWDNYYPTETMFAYCLTAADSDIERALRF